MESELRRKIEEIADEDEKFLDEMRKEETKSLREFEIPDNFDGSFDISASYQMTYLEILASCC